MTSMNSAPLSRSAIIKYHQQWSTSFIIKHHETFSTIIINHHLSAIKCHCFWRIYQWFTIKLPPVTKITTDQWLFLVPLKGGIGSIVHPPIGSIYIYTIYIYTTYTPLRGTRNNHWTEISPYKFKVKDLDQDSVSWEGQDASSIPILTGVTVVLNTGFDMFGNEFTTKKHHFHKNTAKLYTCWYSDE